jgi:hypothetical protein
MRSLILAAMLWAVPAQAYMVLGQGNVSCGTWLEPDPRFPNDPWLYRAWVLGYLTAYNEDSATTQGTFIRSGKEGNVTAGTDTEGLFAWIDNYCRARPLNNLAGAVSKLVLTLENHSLSAGDDAPRGIRTPRAGGWACGSTGRGSTWAAAACYGTP